MKPIVYPYGIVGGLKLQNFTKYLPTAYDESMSMLQKINKVIRQLDEIGETSNDVVDNWNQVMEWVLSEGITQAIAYKTQLWIDDGTLAKIINNETLSAVTLKHQEQDKELADLKAENLSLNERLGILENKHFLAGN